MHATRYHISHSMHVAIQKKTQLREFYQNLKSVIHWNLKDAKSSDRVNNIKENIRCIIASC